MAESGGRAVIDAADSAGVLERVGHISEVPYLVVRTYEAERALSLVEVSTDSDAPRIGGTSERERERDGGSVR